MKLDPKRTTAIGLARYARDFYDVAVAADKDVGMRPGFEIIAPVPVMYLVGHSIELSLKAFLLHQNVPLDDLWKKYGHNLEKCMRKAKELGLSDVASFTKGELDALHALNVLYQTKQLNYMVSGTKSFPVFGPIQSVCRKLLEGVGPYVGCHYAV